MGHAFTFSCRLESETDGRHLLDGEWPRGFSLIFHYCGTWNITVPLIDNGQPDSPGPCTFVGTGPWSVLTLERLDRT